jgi:hypothetical protein
MCMRCSTPTETSWLISKECIFIRASAATNVRKLIQEPPKLEAHITKGLQPFYECIFDRHPISPLPEGLRGLIERIKPAYLTHEFLTDNRGEHERYLSLQTPR